MLLHSLNAQTIHTIPIRLLLKFNPFHPNLSLVLGLVVSLQGVKTKSRASQVSRLGLFSRLDVSSAKDLVTFQHNVRVRKER